MIRVISVYSHVEIFCGSLDEVHSFISSWGMEIVGGECDWVCVG